MSTKFTDIRVIGWGLAALYGVSLAFYFQSFSMTPLTEMPMRPFILTFLLGLLLISSLAVVQLQEWGRNALIVTNAIMGVYLLTPYILQDVIPVAFCLMNVVIVMFFSQRQIRVYFRHVKVKAKKGQWKSILVIDDDETFLKTIRPILMTHGYSVLTASSGEEGLQIVKVQKPDLVMMDVLLPGMKGRDVCRKIKESSETKNIPVIFVTVKDSEDDIAAEKEAGAVAHLTKPIHVKPLILTIQEILEEKPAAS